jgi:hypothetical protein
MAQTTIRIDTQTKDELEKLKLIPQEPFEQVIRRMLSELREGYDVEEGKLSNRANKMIRERLQELSKGKGYNSEEMRLRVRDHVAAKKREGLQKRRGVGKGR